MGSFEKNSRGRGFLLLGLILVQGSFKWLELCEAVSGRVNRSKTLGQCA